MKHIIHSLTTCSLVDLRHAVAKGTGGALHFSFLTSEIVRISYQFSSIRIEPAYEQASEYMTEPATHLASDDVLVIQDEDRVFVLSCRETRIVVEKETASVSVWYRGRLHHGGRVGTADTVLPSYQLRCFTKEGCADSFGRFNFPLEADDEFYGLGDKSGSPNRRGRRFSMFNRDSLGYDASNSDPLYKSVPFLLKHNPKQQLVSGLLFDQSVIRVIDLGRESPFYFMVESEGGPYAYYVLLGDDYHQVMAQYYRVTGFPAFPPLFSFGFFGSSMNYVEPDDAQDRMLAYFATIEEHQIPCEGMYVSSGYLKSPEGKRYAFLWNTRKFPDHRAFLTSLSERGYNLCMNIKPGILTSHPWYEKLKEQGYLIKDQNGQPYREFFWGGDASFIDFNNPDAKNWWKSQLKEQYIDHGCTGIWNDNNELELEDVGVEAYKTRSLYPIKMAQASYEVFKEAQPHHRPWIYSRSGYASLQRYARTWSGDNASDWKTLHFNQYMGIGFGLSGLPYFGHDLGGFFGVFPEEELLIRSCQSAVFQGRFVIHSWREDGNPTEPWSYPTALDPIRSLICEHYRFMPYLYTCAYSAATEGIPLERSLHLEFPEDDAIAVDCVHSLFGPSILKVLVTEKGKTETSVYLPKGLWWYSKEGNAYRGGSECVVPYPCDGSVQWFAKEGSAIPTTRGVQHLRSALFTEVVFLVFPCLTEQKTVTTQYFEDDGLTELDQQSYNLWECAVTRNSVRVTKLRQGIEGKGKRMFRIEVPAGFSCSDSVFDPDALQEGQSRLLSIIG
ncbi:MAG: TIM-barrel domain-containing protein [Sphaerochaeta sp.]|uniref:glycoside hydrolase family 31 protein n=1 Tax=Sphaerochaeta sp. TaxID=1972642 RepID=UPI002FC75B13